MRAGVDINTIRAWLGHVSIDTTNIYAEADLEMKAKALATCEVKETKRSRRWKDKGLMTKAVGQSDRIGASEQKFIDAAQCEPLNFT